MCLLHEFALTCHFPTSFFPNLQLMYASTNDNDDHISSLNSSRDLQIGTLKCFIVTPSVHYVNPTFASLIAQSDTIDEHQTLVGTHIFDIDTPPSPPLVLGSPSSLESAVSAELIANRLFPTPPGSVAEPTATPSSTSPASTFSSPAETSGARYDSSLGTLTRRFVHLLKSVPGQSIDLNDAVKQLGVQKRRIYDITNVLEGIGMIRKDGKNSVAWCGDINVDFNAPQDEQIEKVKRTHEQEVIASQTESKESKRARQELLKAKAHEKKLDSYMRQIGDQIAHYTHEGEHTQGFDYRKHPSTSRRPHYSQQPHPNMYIRYSDLANHPGYKDDNLIALRAPQGTNIEVPDPDQSGKQGERSYQMYMTSQNRGSNPAHAQRGAPIDVHLVRPNTTGNDAIRASVETSKESSPPSPIRSTTNKSDAHNTPVKRVPSEQPETATRPSPFKDASTGQHPHWLQSGNPVSPWVGSPVHGRHQYGHHDFSLGPEASPQRQGHAQFSFSPLHKFTSKHPEPGDFKKSPSDTPERERQAMGLMNSPLGEVLPSTPGLGRTEAALTSKLNYCTQGSPTGSLGDLGRSDSPLYGLSSLASLPPIYSPQPGSSVPIRYSPSPLDWRFPGDSSPEKGSPEE